MIASAQDLTKFYGRDRIHESNVRVAVSLEIVLAADTAMRTVVASAQAAAHPELAVLASSFRAKGRWRRAGSMISGKHGAQEIGTLTTGVDASEVPFRAPLSSASTSSELVERFNSTAQPVPTRTGNIGTTCNGTT